MSTSTSPTTPPSTGATVAPPSGAPLATAPNPDAPRPSTGGGVLNFVRNLFVDSSGNMRMGTVIGAAGLGLLGGWLGSGAGFFGALVGGAAGIAGGTIAGPLVQQVVNWATGTTPGTSFGRAGPANADPDAVIRTEQQIVQPGAPTFQGTLVTPNLDRFATLNSTNATNLATLEQRRRQIETMGINNPARQTAINSLMSQEGIVQQYVANAQAWNQAANEWNNGVGGQPSERDRIINAYDQARAGLGFPPRPSSGPGSSAPIPTAPTGTLNIPRPSGNFGAVGSELWTATTGRPMSEWDALQPREQMHQAMVLIETEIDRQRPGSSGSDINWEMPGPSAGRITNNIVTLGGNVNWPSLIGRSVETHHGVSNRASNWQDCKRDCITLLRNAHQYQPTNEQLDLAASKAQQGLDFARSSGNSVEAQNFERMLEYTRALRARGEGRQAYNQMNQNIANYVSGPASQFQGFVTTVQEFRNQVNQMNGQVASLNQQQVIISGRGQVTAGDDNRRYVTVRDQRNNTEVTMVAERAGGNWQITHTFQGAFNAANVNDANRLPTPMPSSDIFTDNGVQTTANLGNAIRQVLTPMQARLGITPAPAPGMAAPAPTSPGIAPPLSTPTVPSAAPGVAPGV